MNDKIQITAEMAREFLRYEPETGKLFWRKRDVRWFKTKKSCKSWNAAFSCKEAFTSTDNVGYRQGAILGQVLRAHRVIWLIHSGEWPENEVDHINGIRSDNRISNLRSVTAKENMQNVRLTRNNTSGVTGVWKDKKRGKWYAEIFCSGRRYYLGRFDMFEDAVKARKRAESKHGFHPNHGRNS